MIQCSSIIFGAEVHRENYVMRLGLTLLLILVSTFTADAEEFYSPETDYSYPSTVYWGDTHLHTNLSFDSYLGRNTKLDPDQAYRFAKGETIQVGEGQQEHLPRPLDFLVVADHAMNMGVLNGLAADSPGLLSSERGRHWASLLKKSNQNAMTDPAGAIKARDELSAEMYYKWSIGNDAFYRSVWSQVTAAADKHNMPGKFTAFIGYEWTVPFFNLHRVVIFKDDAQKAGQVIPFTQFDSVDPEDLWQYLHTYEKNTGGEVLAIPHNGNLSQGAMFALEDARGNPLSKLYAQTRSRWEPLFEVTQMKGDSETHPVNSPADEFADYETFSHEMMLGSESAYEESVYTVKRKEGKKLRGVTLYDSWFKKNSEAGDPNWQHRYEYARSALKLGLGQLAELGVNPFKFGMIGSTDAHSSLSRAGDGYSRDESTPPRDKPNSAQENSLLRNLSAAGLAAVWAEENTRESLFAAMRRKEVYATTGSRIKVRFFGGWDYRSGDALRSDLAPTGYHKGVPMGGDLAHAPKGKAPSFLIQAVKDPMGANLDRVQVIKGWRDKRGELHEKIYNVALSDGRQEKKTGNIQPVGNTVDLKNRTYTNTIGTPELAVVWQDPNFNRDELAFYYVRVLEIPTLRKTTKDIALLLATHPEPLSEITQERAYSSPIWYTP